MGHEEEAEDRASGSATMNAGAGRAIASAGTATILVKGHLWPRWAHIAIRNEAEAWVDRRDAEAAYAAYATGTHPGPSAALVQELDAAMVAVSATPHALDGFYGAIRNHSGLPEATWRRWRKNRRLGALGAPLWSASGASWLICQPCEGGGRGRRCHGGAAPLGRESSLTDH